MIRERISRRAPRAALAFVLALVLAGCAFFGDQPDDPTLNWTPDRLYAEAKDEMASANWERAVALLESLESRYPFGRWAQQAQIEIAYAHYKDGESALALAAVDRFMRLHPNHANLDYALYLKGLINFNEDRGLLARLGGQDLSERDQFAVRAAFDAFRELVERFPQSRYAPDATARLQYLLNSMASGEVHIARHYFLRGAHVAAINRAQGVVKDYPETPAVEEALYIMMRAYQELDMLALRDDTERVLRQNFPQSRFFVTGLERDDRRWWEVWR
ncbi:MAG: outer membrane protein assembly factor BamD [Burkholderiales bacterium]|nr:MAG: outer membrane protein assembly factor BamD [Burkholderiales bacterium]